MRFLVVMVLLSMLLQGCTGALQQAEPTPNDTLPIHNFPSATTPFDATVANTPTFWHADTPAATASPTIPTMQTASPLWVHKENWFLANQIRAMLIDDFGDLWTGGPDGLVHWDQKTGKSTVYVAGTKTHGSQVIALAQMPDHALWIGTYGNGVARLDKDGRWRTYTVEDGLPSNYISSLVVTPDGTLWVDTAMNDRDLPGRLIAGSIGKFDGQQWIPGIHGEGGGFYKVVPAPNSDLWMLLYAADDARWKGVGRIFGSSWETLDILHAPIKATAITVAPDGEVWIAAQTGIFRYDGQNWKKIIPPWIGKSHADVSDIEVSTNGVVWFGFSVAAGMFGIACGGRGSADLEMGVYRYDGRNWTNFTTKDGLVDNKICDITSSPDGSVWFGSFDQGVSRFDGQRWISYIIQ